MRACAPAPTRASTAKTIQPFATGSGLTPCEPDPRRQRRLDEPQAVGRRRGRARRARSTPSRRRGGARGGGTSRRARRHALLASRSSRRGREGRARRAGRAGAAPQPARPRRDRRGDARPTAHSARRRVRHRVSPDASGRGVDVRTAGAVARRVGHPPLRLPRPLGAVGGRAGARAATRRLPSRRRLLGHGGARRPIGGHDDGLQPAGGRADGDAFGIDRRRDRPAPPAPREARPRGDRARLSSRNPACSVSRRETARVEELERSGSPAAKLALRVFAHRVAASVAAMAASLDGIDALVFTAGIGEGSAASGTTSASGSGFLGVELDVEANAAAVPDVDVHAPGAPCASSCCEPARTSSRRAPPKVAARG